jgi:hypothetical protein
MIRCSYDVFNQSIMEWKILSLINIYCYTNSKCAVLCVTYSLFSICALSSDEASMREALEATTCDRREVSS